MSWSRLTLRPAGLSGPGLALVTGHSVAIEGGVTMIKLTDTQLVLLSAAAQRGDHLIVIPDQPLPNASRRAIAKLLTAALIEEIPAPRKASVWRIQDERPLALRITAAGLAAIVIEEAETDRLPEMEGKEPAPAKRGRARKSGQKAASVEPASKVAGSAPTVRDTKQGRVIAMLRGRTGATLAELMGATGWQAHSVRGFLSAVVRKKLGLPIASEKAGGERRYRIAAAAAASRR